MTSAARKADPGIGQVGAAVGTEAWAQRVRLDMQALVNDVDTKPGSLRRYVDILKKHAAWTLMNRPDGTAFRTLEEFCEHAQPWGLGRPWQTLEPYIIASCGGNRAQAAALTTRPEAAPTPGGKRKGAGRPLDTVIDDAGEIVPNPAKGAENPRGNQRSRPNAEKSRGETASYLAARIARDAPEVHEAMKRGEYRSVRAAAVAAGIVKAPDPVTVAKRALAKVPEERRAEVTAPAPEPVAATPSPKPHTWSATFAPLDAEELMAVLRLVQNLLLAKGVRVRVEVAE